MEGIQFNENISLEKYKKLESDYIELKEQYAQNVAILQKQEKSLLADLDKLKNSHSIVESANIILFSIDTDYNYTYFSELHKIAMQQVWDSAIEIGRNILDCINDKECLIRAKKNFDSAFCGKSFAVIEQYDDIDLNRKFWEIKYSPVYNQQKEIVGVSVLITDITEYKLSEYIAKNNEHQLSNIITNLPGMVFRCLNDSKWSMIYLSFPCKNITGYSPDELINNRSVAYYDLILPTFREYLYRKWQNILKTKNQFEGEYQIITAEGHTKWVWERGYGVYDDNNNELLYLEGYIEDINNRKMVEDSLRESEEKHRILFENSPDAYIIISNNLIIECNQSVVRMLNANKIQIIGKSPGSFSPKYQPNGKLSSENAVDHIIEAEIEGKSHFEWVHKRLNGEEFWVEVMLSSFISEGKLILFGTWREISERKKFEYDLIESESKFRLIFENMEDLYYQTDKFGIIQIVSPNIQRFTDWNPEEVIGKNASEFYPNPDNRTIFMDKILEHGFVNDYEVLLLTKFGNYIQASLSARVILDSNGAYQGVSGLLRDISSRKQAEYAINESRKKYKLLADNISDVIWVLDLESYRLSYVSPSIEIFTGFTVEEALAHTLSESFTADSIEIMKSIIPSRVEKFLNNDNSEDTKVYELQQNCKDGSVVWAEVTLKLISDSDRNSVNIIGLSRNIQKRKEIEKQIQDKTDQLEISNSTKDKFFSIIAHDLKNPLGSFKEISTLLYDNYSDFGELERKEVLLMLKNSSSGLFALLENLLEWSRSQRGLIQFIPFEFNLYFIACNCVELLQLSADNKNIALINSIPIVCNIIADPNLITTVLRNLISNAIKFTPVGGEITIGLLNENDDENTVIFVQDNGVGISQEKIEKLFRIDANVSSKGTSGESGTGLGLILCKEFVEKHNGKLKVESELNKSTIFYFSIPKI